MFNGQGGLFASRQHDLYSFNNRHVLNDIAWPQKIIWHGAFLSGERAPEAYCDAWTSNQVKHHFLKEILLNFEPIKCHSQAKCVKLLH
jgi:Collagenase NC10 and Endostatin